MTADLNSCLQLPCWPASPKTNLPPNGSANTPAPTELQATASGARGEVLAVRACRCREILSPRLALGDHPRQSRLSLARTGKSAARPKNRLSQRSRRFGDAILEACRLGLGSRLAESGDSLHTAEPVVRRGTISAEALRLYTDGHADAVSIAEVKESLGWLELHRHRLGRGRIPLSPGAVARENVPKLIEREPIYIPVSRQRSTR